MPMPQLMGIVNVTPDSFSDCGEYLDPERAIAHCRELLAEGAEILDIGGESTRPGAAAVGADEESGRVLPVIAGLAAERARGARISIDTSKAEVAAAAIEAGATIVNDVTALADPAMAPLCAAASEPARPVELVLMHMQGTPRTMQADPVYDDVVSDVRDFLTNRIERALAAGIVEERIWIDPGIGFGKTLEHNLELLRRLGELRSLGRPIVLCTSLKSFIGKLTGREVGERLGGSIATAVLGARAGAEVLRVHDVAATRDALRVAEAVAGAPWRR